MNHKIQKRKILLVEDDQDFGWLVQHILQGAGYEVYFAGSGKAGLELCTNLKPEIVFLDMRLPDMDSSELARTMSLLDPPKPEVIGLTGYAPSDLAAELKAGAIETCIQKPLSLVELTDALKVAIEKPSPVGPPDKKSGPS